MSMSHLLFIHCVSRSSGEVIPGMMVLVQSDDHLDNGGLGLISGHLYWGFGGVSGISVDIAVGGFAIVVS